MSITSDMTKKRDREIDSVADPAESKRVRVDSAESTGDLTESERSRVDSEANSSESALDSVEAKSIQDQILNILDSSDSATDRDPAIHGLDSVIKSFEEEINFPEIPISGESQAELGYLLEASDDELGLPPTSEVVGDEIEASEFESGSDGIVLEGNNGAYSFEDEIPSYDSFEFEFGIGPESNDLNGDSDLDYVALGGLFDGWDGGYENGAVLWRTESLPAL